MILEIVSPSGASGSALLRMRAAGDRRPASGQPHHGLRPAASGDKEPAAEVDLVKVEQFLVPLGPPARFKTSAQLAHHALRDSRPHLVPDRYAAPDLLVEVSLRPPPVGGEVAVAAVPRDGYRLQPGADRAGPLGQRRPAGAQLSWQVISCLHSPAAFRGCRVVSGEGSLTDTGVTYD